MLCHGNVCRSPLAGAVLARVLGADRVRSRALKGYEEGRSTPPAAKKVREYAERQGYDLTAHRAVVVLPEDVAWADVILYMDQSNYERMGEIMRTQDWPKAKCLAAYIGKDKLPDPGFVSRGPLLEKLLTWVHLAAEACAAELTGTKRPRT